jgi:hypothetical protein
MVLGSDFDLKTSVVRTKQSPSLMSPLAAPNYLVGGGWENKWKAMDRNLLSLLFIFS